ncbi:hypothetical protein EV11_0489 [Prochlorococcus sp. SS52]|uniref:Uncharacterized protein n=1 Tax=Prochlorococcus marinus (strain SARG / CCMP1375 / SS120) TaxID=167539 RepID=Q7VCZ4_PROMA|nr:Predicted protein [Prochlorococcus marinus subsp. marinus str. CCMP1375]KGG11087.1 hypothetical protein EV04_1160 [Prochlorococcus marinus str. LG]KGG21425.1 hypothetical protein EV08_0510 [Prochlorococcus marinus str. SS2]KGG23230.1 hypothetical protein EV09_1978 [Prochlorococcus marinus str. SS35]KGG33941.1 hypothetical protein EV10_0380 [Prochlorococcus marinus str. SS51]KGG36709.1 hypothetical protein EV11_0489 [Prochlorococcus sp. SS52]
MNITIEIKEEILSEKEAELNWKSKYPSFVYNFEIAIEASRQCKRYLRSFEPESSSSKSESNSSLK